MSTNINPAMQSVAAMQMGRQTVEPNSPNQVENPETTSEMTENTAPVTQITFSSTNTLDAPLDYLDLQPTQQVNAPLSAQDMASEQNTTSSGLTYASALQAEANFFNLQSSADLSTPDSTDAAMNE